MGILIALILLGVLVGLFLMGWLPVSAKRAVMFHGPGIGKNSSRAHFTACTGKVLRAIHFPETRSCSFHFYPQIRGGEVDIRLLDFGGKQLLALDAGHLTDVASVQRGKFYFLVADFRKATGEYHLNWE